MDAAVAIILENIAKGTPGVLSVVGWGLFIVERYYLGPRRERHYRADLIQFKIEYKELAEKTADTIGHFMTILEIIKDRVGR